MRAYYYDNTDGSPSLAHDSGRPVSKATLESLGIMYWSIPVDEADNWQKQIDEVAREREYKNRDIAEPSRNALGHKYDDTMAVFWKEHMHDDEEIRYAITGGAYFDVRELPTDEWIRIHVQSGDLLVLPAGIYHRFTLDGGESVKMLRLFKDEPKWKAHYRGVETDQLPHRLEYVEAHRAKAVAVQ